MDGAFCSYTKQDKLDYLQWLNEGGVSNIEMESTCFAALTHQAGIRSAVVCVTLLDRLNEDQVRSAMPAQEMIVSIHVVPFVGYPFQGDFIGLAKSPWKTGFHFH